MQPALTYPGACIEGDGVRFVVWASHVHRAEVIVHCPDGTTFQNPLIHEDNGTFSAFVPGIRVGTRYQFRLDERGPFPDPASRYQPLGVHGPSEIIDPTQFVWSDNNWRGRPLADLVIYELHIGTFTPEGTFRSATKRLPELQELGINAIEMMPVADFAGERNWGYDGVSLYAPARCYGRPEDLASFIDAAHARGIAVLLDVVYNHLGPDGNYLGAYLAELYTTKHSTPWGAALNFDGSGCRTIREFIVRNALYWLDVYHFDGLRLDATDAIQDANPVHVLAELSDRVHQTFPDREISLIAEDGRNQASLMKPPAAGGCGMDAVWADDFHHILRRHLHGDHEGYYQDYQGILEELATTIRQGWFYCGEYSAYRKKVRGTLPAGLTPQNMVVYIQNHDQIGNRAFGERLHHQIDPASYRAASLLLLMVPQVPLLFMGQEWAASAPFCFFTDHSTELGAKVTEGRRREYRHFSAYREPDQRELIPDPQDPNTFAISHLDWDEVKHEPHAGIRRLYQALLALRPRLSGLRAASTGGPFLVEVLPFNTLHMCYPDDEGNIHVLVHFGGAAIVPLSGLTEAPRHLLCTEDPSFTEDSQAIEWRKAGDRLAVHFGRSAGLVYRER